MTPVPDPDIAALFSNQDFTDRLNFDLGKAIARCLVASGVTFAEATRFVDEHDFGLQVFEKASATLH